jgi:hypothetical protein
MAWTARMLIDAALLFTAAERMGVLRRRSFRSLLIPVTTIGFAGAAGAAMVAAANVDSQVARIVIAVALSIALAAMFWLVALSSTERRRVTALFRPAV